MWSVSLPAAGRAQTWTVEPRTSLAWWQLNPHLGHLWATTCPQDPSWQAGESRGVEGDKSKRKEVAITNTEETRVPLYPRESVSPVCAPAVRGSFTVRDTSTWGGAQGEIAVATEHLFNGMEMRDEFARRSIYDTAKYPDVRFYLDSLVNVRRTGGGIQADAAGSFEFRGVRTRMTVPIEATRTDGGLRVQGKFEIPAGDLTGVYGVSKFSLGLGIATHIWRTLHMGFDVVLQPQGGARNS